MGNNNNTNNNNSNKDERFKTHSFATVFGIVLISIGIAILLYPVVIRFIDTFYQGRLESFVTKEWEKHPEENLQQIEYAEQYNEELAYYAFNNQLNAMTPKTLGAIQYSDVFRIYNPFSFLKIPAINIKNLGIKHGVGDNALYSGLGHLPGTSYPVGGKNTHAVITGHSGLIDKTYFSDLEKMRLGDKFYFNTMGRKLAYKVIRILIVEPHEVKYLRIYKDKDLATLITCVPLGINTHRLLVTGKRVPYVEDDGRTWAILGLITSLLTLLLGIIFALIFRFSRFRNFYNKWLLGASWVIAVIIVPLYFFLDDIYGRMLLINDYTIIYVLLFAVFTVFNMINEVKIRRLLNLFAESDIIYYRVYNEKISEILENEKTNDL